MINFSIDDMSYVATLNGVTRKRFECSSTRFVFMFDNLVLKIDSVGPSSYGRQCEAEAIFYSHLKPCDKMHFAKIVQSGYYKDRAYTIQERIFGVQAFGHHEEMDILEKRFGLYDLDYRNVIKTSDGKLVIVDYGLSTIWEKEVLQSY